MDSITPEKPKRRLSKKQKGFVKDYIKTGNGVEAAMNNYDIQSKDKINVANVIAVENLQKPTIQQAIAEYASRFPEEDIIKKHNELLNASSLERINFDADDDDETVKKVVAKLPGYTLLHIVNYTNDDGEVTSKYAYVRAPDNLAQDKALDKVYKLKGSYAAEKNLNVNVDIKADVNPETLALAKKYEEEIKKNL